mgnify:CR=1 FL=1
MAKLRSFPRLFTLRGLHRVYPVGPFFRGEEYTKYTRLLEFETRRRTSYKIKNCIFSESNLSSFFRLGRFQTVGSAC